MSILSSMLTDTLFKLSLLIRGALNPGKIIAMVLIVTVLNGCMVGPDYQKPTPPKTNSYTAIPITITASSDVVGGDAQKLQFGKEVPTQWWTLFNSPYLNRLVEMGFKQNPNIESAQAALNQAQEFVYAQQGYFYPTLGASYSPTRQKLAGNTGGNSPGVQNDGSIIQTYSNPTSAPYNKGVIFNFHTVQLNVGYIPDVFGGRKRALESVKAQADIQRYQLQATYLTLASNIVAAATQEAMLEEQIDSVNKMIEANKHSLEIIKRQFDLGAANRADVSAQESALAQSELPLPLLTKQLAQNKDLIRVLVGKYPYEILEGDSFNFSNLQLPVDLPLSLPSQLVEQRPDVRAADAQVQSASALVGVALANRLPQFAITATYGGTANSFVNMFKQGADFWSLAGSISQTIFDGGTLKHQQAAAEQALKQAQAQYKSTVISAFQNVADTLYAINADSDELRLSVDAEKAAKVNLDITEKQNLLGATSYLAVLTAQSNYRQTQLVRIQAQATRLGDTAALFQALGGDWLNNLSEKSINLSKE